MGENEPFQLPNITNSSDTITEKAEFYHVVPVPIKAFIMVLIILTSAVGNILVFVAFIKVRRLRSIITNYFLVSLAVADLLVALVPMVFNASVEISGKWIFPQEMCDFWNSFDVYICTVSILHLCCTSIDRFFVIKYPFKHARHMNKHIVTCMLVPTWILPLFLSFLPIYLGVYAKEGEEVRRAQNPDSCDFEVNKTYAIISSSFSFWIPSVIMIILYIQIFREARRHETEIAKQIMRNSLLPESINIGAVEGETPTPTHEENFRKSERRSRLSGNRETAKFKREHRAAKVLCVIMGAFLLCWCPFFLWYLTQSVFEYRVPQVAVAILFWIGYFNSTLNPVIYAVTNKDFREAFREVLTCKRRRNRDIYLNRNESGMNGNTAAEYRDSRL